MKNVPDMIKMELFFVCLLQLEKLLDLVKYIDKILDNLVYSRNKEEKDIQS